MFACPQNEIQDTSREEAPNVDAWIANAKTLQDDIESSKRLANEIIRQAEADERREEVLKEQENYVSFLDSEVAFNKQLRDALLLTQEVSECLEQAEALVHSRKILEALHLLDSESIPYRDSTIRFG
jgi:protein transport protein DSL1/ZW10